MAGVGGAKSRKTGGAYCAQGEGLLWGEKRPTHRTGTMSHSRTWCGFNCKIKVEQPHGLVSQRRVCVSRTVAPPAGGGIDEL